MAFEPGTTVAPMAISVREMIRHRGRYPRQQAKSRAAIVICRGIELGSKMVAGMADRIRIIKHEAIPRCGSLESPLALTDDLPTAGRHWRGQSGKSTLRDVAGDS